VWARLPTEVTGAARPRQMRGTYANDSNLTSGTLTPERGACRGNRRGELVRDHPFKLKHPSSDRFRALRRTPRVPCSFSAALRQRARTSRKPTPCGANRRANEPGDLPNRVGSSSSPHHFNRTPPRLLVSGKEGLPVVRRAGWHRRDLALLSPPLVEVADLSIERSLSVRLPPVIAHPQLQRHGALNRVSANDETKRVSARVVKHPRNRRQTVALACGPERLAAQWLADLGERGRLGEPRSKPSLLRGGLVNRPMR
jgi:hypothetical protein